MKSLIIGMGEVGKALFKVLNSAYGDVAFYNASPNSNFGKKTGEYDMIHICFGYDQDFLKDVHNYQEQYKATFTIVHSTVPVGTCRKLGAIHSPIRGIHPNLAKGIKTFPKYLAGPGVEKVADYFRKAGIKVVLFNEPEISEAGKLFDTEYYRACIEFSQRVKAYCRQYSLNFHEVYTLFNQSYNEGYTKLGYPEYVRPVLEPLMQPIGGHCVLPNAKLLQEGDMAE